MIEWASEWVTVGVKLTHVYKILKEKSYYFKPSATYTWYTIFLVWIAYCGACLCIHSACRVIVVWIIFFFSIIYLLICRLCVCALFAKVKSPFIKFNLKTYLFVRSLCLSPPHRINVACIALCVLSFHLIFTSIYVSRRQHTESDEEITIQQAKPQRLKLLFS